MIFADTRLPDELGIALEEDRLVVFAGTGISNPPPSCLPLFNGLACQISGLESVAPGKEDQILGKVLRDHKTDVHSAAARILYNPGTRPTELHKQILRVFGSPNKVRVVTTNFDNHFSDAARNIFRKAEVPEYCAPALPLGDDFQGIVYLHGSARINPRGMVLTDKDFGIAYLTRGWARDFLVALFSKYTVVFVGYSHNDVTTSYLARGLNQIQIQPRWSLISSDEKLEAREHWEHLEIRVMQYPIEPTNNENTHQPLTEFFTGWARHAKESLLHRSRRVRAIAAALPPESETVSEYLAYCLRHPRLAEDFCGALRHPAWVGWLRANGYFAPLFNDSATNTPEVLPLHHIISHWLATTVRTKHPELLLEIIESHHQKLKPFFTHAMARCVCDAERRSADQMFAVWVSIILAQGRQAIPDILWVSLLEQCRIPEHTGVALRLLRLLTTPEIRLRTSWSSLVGNSAGKNRRSPKTARKKVDCEIIWPEDSGYHLGEIAKKFVQPNVACLAESLVHLATDQLTSAYLLLRDVGQSDKSFDPLSWSRSSIAPHSQDRDSMHPCLSFVIDIARDVLLNWICTDSVRAEGQIRTWWLSEVPLLRRLAIFGIGVFPKLSADERLQWLLANDLLFYFGIKKEVFDVLATAYPHATVSVKRRLLRRIDRGVTGKFRMRLTPETLAYERFNMLVYLRRSDPKCELVERAIEGLHRLYPHFGEREHPEFAHWHSEGGFVDPKEGFNFDKILSEPPAHYLNALLKASDPSTQRDRWSFLSNLSALFSKNREWAKGFIDALVMEQALDENIWQSVFIAWREIIKSHADWEWILGLMENLPKNPAIFAGVANLLSHGIWQANPNLSDELITKAASLMDHAWDICRRVEEPPDEAYRDWLQRAINHEGGWIAEFWVHYCSHLRQRAGSNWQGIPATLKSKMKTAISGSSQLSIFARIAMTSWMDYIYEWDKQFAEENFIPLLDWQRDAIVAQQTWSILLHYRQGTSNEMEKRLLPYYQQCAHMIGMLKNTTEKADQFDDHALNNLGHYLAGLAMRVIHDPLKSRFFHEFLPLLPDKVRASLAIGIDKYLEATPEEKVKEIWNTWLREYLDLRLVGVPVALSIDETKNIAEWCLHLSVVFPEAVQRIVQMPLKNVFAYSIIDKLQTHPMLDKYPKESCGYVVAILKGEDFPHLHPALLAIHDKFKKTIPGTPEFQTLEELLYLRGWKNNP